MLINIVTEVNYDRIMVTMPTTAENLKFKFFQNFKNQAEKLFGVGTNFKYSRFKTKPDKFYPLKFRLFLHFASKLLRFVDENKFILGLETAQLNLHKV